VRGGEELEVDGLFFFLTRGEGRMGLEWGGWDAGYS